MKRLYFVISFPGDPYTKLTESFCPGLKRVSPQHPDYSAGDACVCAERTVAAEMTFECNLIQSAAHMAKVRPLVLLPS
jgi:hypothetical protein